MAGKKRKIRVEFQKNRQKRSRDGDLTRTYASEEHHPDAAESGERMSGKGALSRRRTIIVDDDGNESRYLADSAECFAGRVLVATGLTSIVERVDLVGGPADEARGPEWFECAVRRVVRTVARDSRNAVVSGDRVLVRATGHRADNGMPQAVIEKVLPRYGVLSRGHNNREHILAANVDQAMIVVSAAEPALKPALIDRFLLSCEKGGVRPLICINKADLAGDGELEPILLRYRQLGYETRMSSAKEGWGLEPLRQELQNRTTVLSGQSGVGKSSLLNAIDGGLDLKTGDVSGWSMKGKHTTRRAQLLNLETSGYVIDTPGIRQFQLWDVEPGEVEGFFVEFGRYVPECRFPNCSHTHESDCAVKKAVALGMITPVRYESYRRILAGIEA